MRLSISLINGGMFNHNKVYSHFTKDDILTIHGTYFYAKIPLSLITSQSSEYQEYSTTKDSNMEKLEEEIDQSIKAKVNPKKYRPKSKSMKNVKKIKADAEARTPKK